MAGEHTLAEPWTKITTELSIPASLTNDPFKNQLSTPFYNFLFLQILRYGPEKISKVKVTTTRLTVAHLHLLTNVPNKYQLTLRFPRCSLDKIFKFDVTAVKIKGQIKVIP